MSKTSCASLVNRIETNANGLQLKIWQQDEQFMQLWNAMHENLSVFQAPIGKVRKKKDKPTLDVLEEKRKRAYTALKLANNVFAVSETASEKQAYSLINDQLNAMMVKIQKNKENTTTSYKLLVDKLSSDEFKPHVSMLKLESYVQRLSDANSAFQDLEQTTVLQKVREKNHAEDLRTQLMDSYTLMTNYVQTMEAMGKESFAELFDVIDEARGYFARDLSYRETLKKNKKTDKPKDEKAA